MLGCADIDMLSAFKAVPEVTVGRAFHYGLRPREFDGRRSDLSDVIVKITDQECAQLRLTQCFKELRKTTSVHVVVASVIFVPEQLPLDHIAYSWSQFVPYPLPLLAGCACLLLANPQIHGAHPITQGPGD